MSMNKGMGINLNDAHCWHLEGFYVNWYIALISWTCANGAIVKLFPYLRLKG